MIFRKMKKIFLLITACFASVYAGCGAAVHFCAAVPSCTVAIDGGEIAEDEAALIERALSFGKLSASYRMIRSVPAFSEKSESSGTLEIYGDGRLYWHSESPDKYLFFTDGSSAYVEKNGERQAVSQAFSGIFSFITEAMPSSGTLENRFFSVSSYAVDDERIGLVLTPSRGAMSSFISKIDIVLSSSEAIVKEVNVLAANGSVIRIIFDNVVKE